ncbi:carbonic anhydrase [Chitinophaga costaii]|uniref:Carbonic anhydrase n=1 Tax=Chitinophaga costaii TaxID=1335309 RepID=A0A1C4AFV4_9BACT|nr:SulP family inorganic anion transporter [Chitinophaga costaii]PUZ26589.1 SulP family inorganic anion transporter [Chitinophaga costaii]SCB93480.1 carbonic anhydrase [Chitinophaga costaii]
MQRTKLFAYIKEDAAAGLVVFLIAVPLCLGIALASGAPLFSGLIAGMAGGLVVGALSGSHVSVSGPAAGLTAILLTAIGSLGAFDILLASVVIGGCIQLLLGFVKAGTIANYFPSNVIKGMLAAIGIIIILKQLPNAFGYFRPAAADSAFEDDDTSNMFVNMISTLKYVHIGATIITVISLLIILYWKKIPGLKVIPAALAAVIAGIGLQLMFSRIGGSFALSPKHLVSLPVPSSVQDFIGQFTFPRFSALGNKEVWVTGVTIAIIASIETLLNLEAADKLDKQKRYSSPNQELKAQGIGNIVSGMLGGLPVTSVIVRSSANIDAGARTRMASIIHGALLLVCAAFIPVFLNKIPLATLAAVLLVTGFKLCKPAVFKEMFLNGKYQWVPFLVTVVTIVATDLLIGISVGMAVSVLSLLRGNIKSSYYFSKSRYREGQGIRLELAQEVSFLNKASILLTLDHLPANTTVIIDASKTAYIDYDVLEIIREFTNVKALSKNINVLLTGFKPVYKIVNHPQETIHSVESNVQVIALGNHEQLIKELQMN